jgi:N-[(2S)-2-amino-2-carboxyethyl]-L-glutamate dehydrogenase
MSAACRDDAPLRREGEKLLSNNELRVLCGADVECILAGREQEVIRVVRRAYEAHHAGQSQLPHSLFLRFPEAPRNRLIALPAFLADGFDVAGIKWISSFPDNLKFGGDRASAVLILNSVANGRPETILEGSLISAKRTAASATLAANILLGQECRLQCVGLVGCGPLNFETLRFIHATHPELRTLFVHDLIPSRAEHFLARARDEMPAIEGKVDEAAVFRNAELICLATTATEPHITDLSMCTRGTVILHLSLRDLSPEVIQDQVINVVDDADHVCRASTSLHLAEQAAGNRSFISADLPTLLARGTPWRPVPERVTVFSPFGLGILDIAVATYVRDEALKRGLGIPIRNFFPDPWRSVSIANAVSSD